MSPHIKHYQQQLKGLTDPLTKRLARLSLQQSDAQHLSVTLQLNYPISTQHISQYREKILQTITPKIEPNKLSILTETNIKRHLPQPGCPHEPRIKNIIGISSTKGGVGKSTIATYIALSLKNLGVAVGLVDADIFGPNQPLLLGQQHKPEINGDQYEPISAYGMPTMSMGYLVDTHAPLIWRGPMVSAYAQQIIQKTNWPQLDYLIIDLPPGTGDIQLTLAKKIPTSGIILVTTPQVTAIQDVTRGIAMYHKLNIPILGFIENMAHSVCPNCQHQWHPFGKAATQRLINDQQLTKLGTLPLDQALSQATEDQQPLNVQQPNHPISQAIEQITSKACAILSTRPQDLRDKIPPIVVET